MYTYTSSEFPIGTYPRICNTGVLITDKGISMYNYSLDYLGFTAFEVELEEITKYLPQEKLVALEKGRMGYKKAYLYEKIAILYDGQPSMGIHFDCPSQGLANILDILTIPALQGSLKYTRIDIACDIKDKDFFNQCYMACLTKNYKSRRKSWTDLTKRATGSNALQGRTLYFGSRTSETFLRIYDKALEQGEDIDWTRVELEIKGKSAHNLACLIGHSPIDEIFSGILNSYLTFIDRTSSKNISRCKTLDFWEDMLTSKERVTISPEKKEKNISDTYSWLLKQVSRSLGKISYFDDIAEEELTENLVKIGRQKISEEDKARAEKFKESWRTC